jgi:HK97 family phage prohead protease
MVVRGPAVKTWELPAGVRRTPRSAPRPPQSGYRAQWPGRYRLDEPRNGNAEAVAVMLGHFAVFNEWTEIHSGWEGDFMERIAPGAFKKTILENLRNMAVLFQHGRDPHIGDKVLGPIAVLREDKRGAYYEVPLLDTSHNRDLIPGLEANLYGASFRFKVMKETYDPAPYRSAHNPNRLPERTVTEARVFEWGPCSFPAYQGATAGLRSISDMFITPKPGLRVKPSPPAAGLVTDLTRSETRCPECCRSRSSETTRPSSAGCRSASTSMACQSPSLPAPGYVPTTRRLSATPSSSPPTEPPMANWCGSGRKRCPPPSRTPTRCSPSPRRSPTTRRPSRSSRSIWTPATVATSRRPAATPHRPGRRPQPGAVRPGRDTGHVIEPRHSDEWACIAPVLERARGQAHVAQLDLEQADITEDELNDGTNSSRTGSAPPCTDATAPAMLEAVLDGGVVRTIVFNAAGEELQRWVKALPGHPVLN